MRICIFGDARSVHLQRIVPGLVERGQDVHVVTHKPADIPGATVERFCVPMPRLTNLHRWYGRWMRYLQDFMRRFDVVHVHFLADWGFTPEVMAEGCFVVSPWGSDIVPPPGEGRARPELIEARLGMLRHADLVTVWGPTFAETVARFAGLHAESIELLPLGVDLELFRPFDPPLRKGDTGESDGPDHPFFLRGDQGGVTSVRKAPSQPSNQFRVGYFKGFREVYGATYLMRAIPTVVEVLPQTWFHLIGDGPQLETCKMLAGHLGVESHVHWIRRQPHRNLPNHLAGWDLSVIPSVCESFGVAAAESLAMGVPVVASNVGGLPEIVQPDVTGLLVPPQAPEQLADAIITLLQDPTRRHRMGQAGRHLVEEKYNWSTILDRWITTYENALARTTATV